MSTSFFKIQITTTVFSKATRSLLWWVSYTVDIGSLSIVFQVIIQAIGYVCNSTIANTLPDLEKYGVGFKLRDMFSAMIQAVTSLSHDASSEEQARAAWQAVKILNGSCLRTRHINQW